MVRTRWLICFVLFCFACKTVQVRDKWRRESPIGLIAPSSVVAWYGFNLKRILIGARLFMSGHQHMPTLASKGKSNPVSKATHLCLSHSNSCLLLFCFSMPIINMAVAIMLPVTSFHLHVN